MTGESGPTECVKAVADGMTQVTAAPAGGLSSAEAAGRLARYGPNELPRARATPWWRLVADQLRDPLILVLLAAAVLTIATGDLADASVIVLVIVVNTTVGVVQEIKAGQAIAALSDLTAPEARVVRDGGQRQIPAAEVVIGDVLVLAEGDIVPADAGVADAAALLVDEAALTGESVPVEKTAGGPDQAGRVSAGTVVVRGRGRAVVTATGAASSMGRVAALLGAQPGLTPLQRRLAGVGRALAVAAVVLCAIVLAIGLARGQGTELMVITAISLVVAAVPESLPAVITLALALGARRMTARHAIIRRLPAVETLGSVTVIGTDKTGTLTEGTMVARRLWTPQARRTSPGPATSHRDRYAAAARCWMPAQRRTWQNCWPQARCATTPRCAHWRMTAAGPPWATPRRPRCWPRRPRPGCPAPNSARAGRGWRNCRSTVPGSG